MRLDRYNVTNLFRVLRGFHLRSRADSVGRLPLVNGYSYIRNFGRLFIGDNLYINAKPVPVTITVGKKGTLTIGDNGFFNYGTFVGCECTITIGNDVKIGDLSSIVDSSYHQTDSRKDVTFKEVIIGNNVWISRMCSILPGVTIGDNSVIGAGSVVTRDVPGNVLAAGVPAAVIRHLDIPENWIRK